MNQPGEKHITYCCASLDLHDCQSQVNISSFPEIILYFSGPFILLCTFYFLFSPTIPPLQFFLLTNDLALDFTEKIKAERTEICKPAMTSTYPSAAFKPIFSAFLSYFFNISLSTKSFSISHRMLSCLQY